MAEEGKKPGPPIPPKHDADTILARIAWIGQLRALNGWDVKRVYQWNKLPAQLAQGWGYSYRNIRDLYDKARLDGRSLLARDHEEALLTALAGWYDIRTKSLQGGDYKAAVVAQDRIDTIRLGASVRQMKKNPIAAKPPENDAPTKWHDVHYTDALPTDKAETPLLPEVEVEDPAPPESAT
jgi:hypothetical protein